MSIDEKEWEQSLARQRGDDGTGNVTGNTTGNTNITATSNVVDTKVTENRGGGGEKKNKKKNKKTRQDNQQGKVVEKEEKAGKEEGEEQEDDEDNNNDNSIVVQKANKKNNHTATETKREDGPVVVILTTNTNFNESVEASPAAVVSEDKAKEEADVFRIRGVSFKNNKEEKEEEEDGNVTAEGKQEESGTVVMVPKGGEEDGSDANKEKEHNTSAGDDEDTEKTAEDSSAVSSFSEAAKEIAENTVVVSSTTAQLAGDLPFVTIHPTFLKNKGTGECIRSLDNIIRSLSPSSGFLSDDFIPEEYLNNNNNNNSSSSNNNNNKSDISPPSVDKLCLQRVQSLMKAASNENAPVMLFLILLVRIEVAAYLAFGESKKGKVGKKKKNTGLSLPSKHHMDTLVKRIALLETKENLKTLDNAVLEAIVAPLTEAGYCSLGGGVETTTTATDGANVQNLLFSPLPTLIQVFSGADASNRPNFRNWNKAWNGTINNLLEFAKSGTLPPNKSSANSATTTKHNPSSPAPNTPAPSKASTDATTTANQSTPVAIDADIPSTLTTSSANSKKKKKRKNKNKKKKNGNAHNNNNNENTGTNNNSNNNNNNKGGDASSSTNNHQQKSGHVGDELLSKKEGGDSSEKSGSPASSPPDNGAGKGDSPSADNQNSVSPTKIADGKPTNAGSTAENEKKDSGAIVASRSFDENEAKLNASASDETASTKSESTRHDDREEEDKKPAAKSTNKGDFTVSRVHGVGTVVVAPSTTADPSNPVAGGNRQKSQGDFKGEAATEDNHDEWETVEVKGRGNRKKSGRGNAQQASTSGGHASQNGPKKKASRSAGRRRATIRKLVKDILFNVLDDVDEEVRRRRQQEARTAKAATVASPSPAPAPSAWKDASRTSGVAGGNKKEKTLRDVVVGKKSVTSQSKKSPQPVSKDGKGNNNGSSNNNKSPKSSQPPIRTTPNQKSNASPSKNSKGQAPSADQNTAPTIPETVSAVSEPKRTAPRVGRDITRSDSSSADTDDNPKQEEHATTPTQDGKTSSPEPPLPTLLNPGNVNSASSSVASSLEAPHAGHGHRHTSSSNEVDVGYHLLDVCDRLTRDMHVFMARRASALNIRRRERGALLGALQDSVSSIWAGHSHVELYGSCATMLDLPSSDLDVVVCGLDQIDATMGAASSPQHNIPSFGRSVSESISPDKMPEPPMRHTSMPHFVPLQLNAERVMRLAAELERQPWAAHVKAIPTASVPVVKVLADPSRLPGVVPPSVIEGEEWMMQHHHAANHTATGGSSPPPTDFSNPDPSQANSPHYQQVMAHVWRGADVMNGLIQVDITFEGPEHGGIGSTEFSARVVQNVCDETGLAAESTAFVQTIMVVKELLAQRRLNEPFSGGLSSYALLLLVLAVMCERKVVREELDRVEMQRRVVAAGGGNSEITSASSEVELIHRTEKGTQAESHVQKSSTPKSDANPGRSDNNGTLTSTPKAQPTKGKNDSNGMSAPFQNWTVTNAEGDNKVNAVVDNHGHKEAAKNTPQANPQGSKEASKTTPQLSSQGNKQAGKNATQANVHGTKQGGKNPAQGSTQGTKQGTKTAGNAQGHGNKQAAKSPVQTTSQGNKQAKGQGGNKVGNQGRGGNQQRGNNAGGANQQRRGTAGGNQQRGPNITKGNTQNSQKDGSPNLTEQKAAKSPGNSWASIAMGKNKPGTSNGSPQGKAQEASAKKPAQPSKPSSFADAVARNTGNAKAKAAPPSFAKAAAAAPKSKPTNGATTKGESDINKKSNLKQQNNSVQMEEKAKTSTPPQKQNKVGSTESAPPAATMDEKAGETVSVQTGKVEKDKERKIEADEKTSKFNNYSSEPVQPAISSAQSAFPQGFNDVIEVLCSGETTPGKLLMHFLLFYGQHYDAHATAIDISGKHHREIPSQSPPYTHLSPYIQRRSAGTIDPITGMLTVDPIVVYDPLEGAENNNVARRCFLWSSVKWVFAQSYMTLSSAAERNTTPPGTPAAATKDVAAEAKTSISNNKQSAEPAESSAWNGPYTDKGSLFDPSSPLLELLLSF